MPLRGLGALLRTAFEETEATDAAAGPGNKDCDWGDLQLGNQTGLWKTSKADIKYAYRHNLHGQKIYTWWPGNSNVGECNDLTDKSRHCWMEAKLLNDVGCQSAQHCLHYATSDGDPSHTYTCPSWVKTQNGDRCTNPGKDWQACPEKFDLKRVDSGVPQNFQKAMGRTCPLSPEAAKLEGKWYNMANKEKGLPPEWYIDRNELAQIVFHGSTNGGAAKGTKGVLKEQGDRFQAELRDDADEITGAAIRLNLNGNGQIETEYRAEEGGPWSPKEISIPLIQTHGGTGEGSPCMFPFVHEGITFNECTVVDDLDNKPWCMTQAGDDHWGYCSGQVKKPFPKLIKTHGGTANGASCMLPFTDNGSLHKTCTTHGEPSPWCMTDTEGNWGYCDCKVDENEGAKVKAYGATLNPGETKDCLFPFKFNGEEINKCIRGRNGFPWCATDKQGNWGWCSCSDPPTIIVKPKEEEDTGKEEAATAVDEKPAEPQEENFCKGYTEGHENGVPSNMLFDLKQNAWYKCTKDFRCEPYHIKEIKQPEDGKPVDCEDAGKCKEGEMCFVHKITSKTFKHECVGRKSVWLISDGDDSAKFEVPLPLAFFGPPALPRSDGRCLHRRNRDLDRFL